MSENVLDEMVAESAHGGVICHFEKLTQTSPDLADAAVSAVAQGVAYAAISRVLKRHNVPVSTAVLSRHFRGDCKCPTTS